MPSLKIDRFDGGMTDYWVDGPVNCGQLFENLLVTPNGKPTSRPGSAILSTSYAQTATGAQRIGKVFIFKGKVFLCQGDKLYYFDSGWIEVTGGSATKNCFDGVTGYTNYYSVAEWNDHLLLTDDSLSTPVRKLYLDTLSAPKMFSAGLPAVVFETNYPTYTPSSAGTTYNYIYAWHYFREYTRDGNVVFQEAGPVTYSSSIGLAGAIGTGGGPYKITINISSASPALDQFPSPSTSGNNFYDTANIYIKLYRTEANGDVFYYCGRWLAGSLPGGNISEETPDSLLGDEMYTTGDVLEYDPPPVAKYLAVVNDICWYANLVESGVTKPNRIRQSIQSAPDKCPESLYIDVDSAVTGLSSVGNLPIVFCADKFYRLEGYVDNLGTGFTKKVIVSDKIGCISNDSIIQSKDGIAFAAEDGFYFTDGYNVTKVSYHLSKTTYKRLTSAGASTSESTRRLRITGSYDKMTNRYWWAVQDDDDSSDNDACYIWDASKGVKEDGCFTTAVGGSSFAPTAIYFKAGDMYRADRRGYVFLHEDDLYNDPVVDTGAAVTDWGTQVVEYDYKSCAFSFGDPEQTKYVTRITVASSTDTNLSLLVQSANNTRTLWSDLKEIRYRGGVLWGDEDVVWGDEDLSWNQSGSLLSERRFPANGLRCNYKQVRFVNSTTVIARSDDYELATCDNAANTITLPTLTWPTSAAGYYVVTAFDSYDEEFQIVSRSDSVLTVADTYGRFPDGDYAWEIWGKRKNERLLLDSYTITYEPFGNTLQGYRSTQSGHNA